MKGEFRIFCVAIGGDYWARMLIAYSFLFLELISSNHSHYYWACMFIAHSLLFL